ncbi:MAG: hypothetical protein ACHQ4J_15260 [Candidatus Binatia bacterium]
MTQESRLTWALALSVLLHALLLTLLPIMRRAQLTLPQPPALLDVDVLPMPRPKAAQPPPVAAAPAPAQPAPQIPVPKNQIVSPPDAGEEKVPENARLLSDRNNTVKEETIKRGEPLPGDPDAHPKPPEQLAKLEKPHAAPRPVTEETHPKPKPAALPKLDQLLPTAGDLMRAGVGQPDQPAPAPAPEQEASTKRDDLLRHGDPWRSASLHPGSMDFLPAVREGDITMLNTKAEQFAPFVRRVAMRVFENFWMTLRHSVGSRFGQSVQEYAVVEAIMDREGKLVSVNLKDRSGTVLVATDRNLQNACSEGFFDRNPPSGAEANDGNIHFIFQAQVQLFIDPRSGGPAGGAMMSAGLL